MVPENSVLFVLIAQVPKVPAGDVIVTAGPPQIIGLGAGKMADASVAAGSHALVICGADPAAVIVVCWLN